MQLAAELDAVQRLKLGMELCGTYALRPDAERGFVRREWGHTLSTAEKLLKYAEGAGPSHGAALAREAARDLATGAASPAETKVYLLLCLPLRQGGYGLPKPLLNRRVRLRDGRAELLGEIDGAAGFRVLRPDFYWHDANVALEYDSDAHHSGPSDAPRDSKRRGELEHASVRVLTMSSEQLYDGRLLEKMARTLARLLGHRMRAASRMTLSKRARLGAEVRRGGMI